VLRGLPIVAAALAGVLGLSCDAQASEVGAVQRVHETVYGTEPNSQALAKHQGDKVVFLEKIQTWRDSAALLHFVDGSKLTLGASSEVVIDEFVFDPTTVEGNALIKITTGTLRWVTGSMPKGQTVIKTPTATLTLRGTDVAVHVHPDGTTDTTVYDGIVHNHNDLTNTDSVMGPGDQQVSDRTGIHGDTGDPVDPGEFVGDGNNSNDTTVGDPSKRFTSTAKPASASASTPERPQTGDD
jgi:hypothetical protein